VSVPRTDRGGKLIEPVKYSPGPLRSVAHANRIAGEGKKLARFCPKMKVLYMSGYTDAAVARHGKLSPDAPYLQKPFAPEIWARKVRETLD
jgi:hypothetical protein